MPPRLTLLGTGTCQLDGRSTSAVLVELDGLNLLFDCGRGTAARLAELGIGQDELRHVVLSHFHPDHLSDLVPYLHAAAHSRIDPRGVDLTIWGPPGVEERVGRMLELFEPSSLVEPERFRVVIRPIEGERFEIDGRPFDSAELPPAGNRGLRFEVGGTTVALTGDSDVHRAEIDFLTGVDLAVVDAGHPTDEELVELAVASGARRIVCSHLYRTLDATRLNSAARRRGYRGSIEVGRDLARYELA